MKSDKDKEIEYMLALMRSLTPRHQKEVLCHLEFMTWLNHGWDDHMHLFEVVRGAWFYARFDGLWRLWIELNLKLQP
jgi:hypothetical protein